MLYVDKNDRILGLNHLIDSWIDITYVETIMNLFKWRYSIQSPAARTVSMSLNPLFDL